MLHIANQDEIHAMLVRDVISKEEGQSSGPGTDPGELWWEVDASSQTPLALEDRIGLQLATSANRFISKSLAVLLPSGMARFSVEVQ
jgi:hypothetical protein